VINGDTVIKCTKERLTSFCHSTGSSESTPGATYRYKLVPANDNNSIAVIEDIKGTVPCPSVCTNRADGGLMFPDFGGKKKCGSIDGLEEDWLFVGTAYADACAEVDTCNEVEIVQACEGTSMRGIMGKYEPYQGDCEDADQSRSVYRSVMRGCFGKMTRTAGW